MVDVENGGQGTGSAQGRPTTRFRSVPNPKPEDTIDRETHDIRFAEVLKIQTPAPEA